MRLQNNILFFLSIFKTYQPSTTWEMEIMCTHIHFSKMNPKYNLPLFSTIEVMTTKDHIISFTLASFRFSFQPTALPPHTEKKKRKKEEKLNVSGSSAET